MAFGDVNKGDIGGFVESEANLEGFGSSWIYDDAKVIGDAKVYDNARIMDKATIAERAHIFGNARVSGEAVVYGSAKVYGNADIRGKAEVYENARIYDITKIYEGARIYGDSRTYDMVRVHGEAEIFGRAKVRGNIRFYGTNVRYDNIFTNKEEGVYINGDTGLLPQIKGVNDTGEYIIILPERNPLGAADLDSSSNKPTLVDLMEAYGGKFTKTSEDIPKETWYICTILDEDNKKKATVKVAEIKGNDTGSFYIEEDGKNKYDKLLSAKEIDAKLIKRDERGGWVDCGGKFDYNVNVGYLEGVLGKFGFERAGKIFKIQEGVTADERALKKMEDYYNNNQSVKSNVDNGNTSIFAFEGLGSYSKSAVSANAKYHPYGLHGAMILVAKGDTIVYITKNARTLPDDPSYSISDDVADTIKAGVYNFYSKFHGGTMPALRYSPEGGNVPAWSIHTPPNQYANLINIHAGGNTTGTNGATYISTACQTIFYGDYVEFGKSVGFLDSNLNYQASSYNDCSKNLTSYLVTGINVLYILDRSYMPNEQKALFGIVE